MKLAKTTKAACGWAGIPSLVTAALAVACAAPASAYEFTMGDGWEGNWNSSLSLGTAVRLTGPDKRLYGKGDGGLLGKNNGLGNNTTDEGDLNYSAGDPFSSPLKFFTELEVKKDNLGVLLRGKAWYDITLENSPVNLGSQTNGWNGYNPATNKLGSPQPLSDKNFEPLTKFANVDLLDAFVYNTFEVADYPLQVRVGQQVVNWGESLFIQGINQINPIDVPAFRKPGTQLKEVFIPVPIVYANQNLGHMGSLEAFYQWQWRDTPIEAGCGNYWTVASSSISASPGACGNETSFPPLSNAAGVASGYFVPSVAGQKGKDSGQYGLSYHYNVEKIDTEFGLYAYKFNSRTPVIDGKFGNYILSDHSISPMAGKWDYPNNEKLLGLSAATEFHTWSIAGELSRTFGTPAQIDGNDLLNGALTAGLAHVPYGPYGAIAMAALGSPDGYLRGYSRTNKTQFQVNAIKAGTGLGLHEDFYVFVAETGFQWNTLDTKALRYNRPFIFGAGSSPLYGGNTCALGVTINPAGCSGTDGYTTNFAMGYRLKGELTYNNVLGSGVTMYPGIFWSHDVSGYSVDNQFSEDRMALALSMRFSYQQKYSLELDAVGYNPNAKYDPLRDRHYLAATATVSF